MPTSQLVGLSTSICLVSTQVNYANMCADREERLLFIGVRLKVSAICERWRFRCDSGCNVSKEICALYGAPIGHERKTPTSLNGEESK